MRPRESNARAGFVLIELIVACVVLFLGVALVVWIVDRFVDVPARAILGWVGGVLAVLFFGVVAVGLRQESRRAAAWTAMNRRDDSEEQQ